MFAALLVALCPFAPQGPSGVAHWAYQPVARPATTASGPAAVDERLAAHHRAEGLEPAPPADRATLIRRVSLDLTGLLPTPAEVADFAADTRPDAYAQLVDRLLASPHFGERWAVPWLDLARYGDSDGFNFDSPRTIWPYRDWVVDALNRDLPYDRFTTEQLAGDLLPDADEATRIATGFHRNTMVNDEGGVDPDEARWERLLDRAGTTATVWLGATFHCARCHDHKFDPFTQREFYGLVAFFESQDEVALTRAADGVKTLVLREAPERVAATDLRIRGAYDSRGERVQAQVPVALHRWPPGAPKNRLGLARWLTAADNPLFARVQVNRIWAELFGEPIVATPEDFGTRAPAPPLLDVLDLLAAEFADGGFHQKQLIRTVVLTAAYRRGAAVPAAQRGRDPRNVWLARQARFRLDAERLRDAWLQAAGLLALDVGGPPVYPLQADTSGVVPTNKVNMKWPVSDGADRWRRGLYTYVRRTAPFVAATAFDAPSREQCEVRRQRTNTPLQALVALNDPTPRAAAEALGRRMAESGGDDRARLAHGFALCTARAPTADELDRLAAALVAEPASQRWTRIALVLLNLDETLCRG